MSKTVPILLALALLACVPCSACTKTYQVQDVIRLAKRLDGKEICITGVMVLKIVAPDVAVVQSLRDRLESNLGKGERRVGLVEGAAETGRAAAVYRADSFKRLDGFCDTNLLNSLCLIDVSMRGVLLHKRYLMRKRMSELDETDNLRKYLPQQTFETEFVIGEILTATRVSP